MSWKEISAAQEMMKIAINNQSHVDSLIGYYRDKIDAYNNQRAQWVIHYEDIQQSSNDQYLLDEEIKKTSTTLNELKSKLSQKTAQLNAERQKYFKFCKEKQQEKKKIEESKKNYRQLMSSCKPVNLNNKHLNNSSVYSTNGKGHSKIMNMDETKLSVMKQTGNSKTTNLQLELINIKKEHNAKRNEARQKIDSLKDELNQLLGEYSERSEECDSEYKIAIERLADLQKKHMSLTQEYFRFRMTNTEDEKRIQQENELIRLKNLAILQKLKSLESSHQTEFKNIDQEIKKQNKEYKTKYNKDLGTKEEHLTIVKQQHERLQDIYLNKIKKLDEELKKTNSKRQQVEEKGKVQISSLKSQIKILKGRLQKQEVHQMRQQIINDEEEEGSQSLEMSELDKINDEVKNIEKHLNLKK